MMTMTQPIALPLVHAHGVNMSSGNYQVNLAHQTIFHTVSLDYGRRGEFNLQPCSSVGVCLMSGASAVADSCTR